MSERDGYMPGVPCWADTSQPDPEAATEFYGPLFGWEFENVLPEGSPGQYFIGHIRGLRAGAVGSIPEGAPDMAVWNTYVWVESADEATEKARDAGGTVLNEPFDIMDAGRMAVFTDPEGAAICVWEAKENKGAQVVNEHGSVNFNVLNTRDPEAAKAFYGPVFGWELLNMPGGFQAWTLSGYGDHLESLNPGWRAGFEEIGAPDGFADAVATVNPLGDDQPDTPPHWSITFAVDEADPIAEKAAELGGTVLMPPTDMPWVRMTVITDPAGATFTATKFVPENKDL